VETGGSRFEANLAKVRETLNIKNIPGMISAT
jgi:hypothetical protein